MKFNLDIKYPKLLKNSKKFRESDYDYFLSRNKKIKYLLKLNKKGKTMKKVIFGLMTVNVIQRMTSVKVKQQVKVNNIKR